MARRAAGLPAGSRLSDYISLGAVARAVPLDEVQTVLAETGRESERVRDLPAHVMVYYVIALALYMQVSYREVLRCLLEGVRWLAGPGTTITPAAKSAISQARTRLGEAPLRRLFERVAHPVASPATPGAYYHAWHLVSLDGTTEDFHPPEKRGLYIWVTGSPSNRRITYVGQTGNLQRRMYEHVTSTLGGAYCLYDTAALRAGGPLRRTYTPAHITYYTTFLAEWETMSQLALENLNSYEFFWAPVNVGRVCRETLESAMIAAAIECACDLDGQRCSRSSEHCHRVRIEHRLRQDVTIRGVKTPTFFGSLEDV